MKRKSQGFKIPNEFYVGFQALNLLETQFDVFCNDEDKTLIGFHKLRTRFINHFFEKLNRKRRRTEISNSHDDNSENQIIEFDQNKKFLIFGLGEGTFHELSSKIREIRTQNSGRSLSFKFQSSIISFFCLFNLQLQQDLSNIKYIKAIRCEVITQSFNRTWGYHGPVGRGVAFIFEIILTDDTLDDKHYCLGHGCPHGCLLSSFRV